MPENYCWMIELWPLESSPAQKAMKEIKMKDPRFHEAIKRAIRRFLQRDISQVIRARYLKDLKNGLWEFVITAREGEFRMLGVVEYPSKALPQFICLHCFRKKEQKLRDGAMEIGLERLKRYRTQKNEIH